MATTPVVTVRLKPELRERLDRWAKAQRRSRSFVATEAIREYVKVNEWQIEETRKALAEAERGEFAATSQVRRVAKKWNKRSARARWPARDPRAETGASQPGCRSRLHRPR